MMQGSKKSDEIEIVDDSNSRNSEGEQLVIPAAAAAQNASGSAIQRAGKKVSSGSGTTSELKRRKKLRKAKEDEKALAVFIKYAALFLLVAQMVGLVLLMRYSRTQHSPDHPLYLASTAVFAMEVMKLVICLLVIAYQSKAAFLTELNQHILQSPMEILKLCVPSLLYTVQNNLLYLALTNLDAATYQVCYQLKILTTALFSAILLQRRFSGTKWVSLFVLTVGVAIVQVSGSGDQHNHQDNENHQNAHVAMEEEDNSSSSSNAQQNRFVGLIAVLCAACTSGFSGVYFEKILKGSRTSLWIRNVQMGLPSVFIAYLTVYLKDGPQVRESGFWIGYSTLVWTVVTVQAVGGLIVATVVKYADNVLKVFATSFSIVVSCIISAFLFDFHPTRSFLVGASLVVTATVMYSSPEKKVRRKPVLPMSSRRDKK